MALKKLPPGYKWTNDKRGGGWVPTKHIGGGGGSSGANLYDKDFGKTLKGVSGNIDTLTKIGKTGGREGTAIRSTISGLKSQTSKLAGEQRKFLKDRKSELDQYLKTGSDRVVDALGQIRSRKKTTPGDGIEDFDSFVGDLKKSNIRLQDLSKKQEARAGQTETERDAYSRKFGALLRGEIGQGPSQVELAAKQKRSADLRQRAKLLGSLGRRGTAGSIRDYLNQVESQDVDSLQNTAAARASEYYQRRAQLQKELSAQAIAENYYNTQITQQLQGASQSQAQVSRTYGDILSSLATRQSLEQDQFFNEANSLNDLLRTQTGALGEYGRLGAGILGSIGQQQIGTSQAAIGGYGDIARTRVGAAQGAGQLGIGLLGAIGNQSQNAWQQYADQRNFDESQNRDQREYDFRVEARNFQRKQQQQQADSLGQYLQGLRG